MRWCIWSDKKMVSGGILVYDYGMNGFCFAFNARQANRIE